MKLHFVLSIFCFSLSAQAGDVLMHARATSAAQETVDVCVASLVVIKPAMPEADMPPIPEHQRESILLAAARVNALILDWLDVPTYQYVQKTVDWGSYSAETDTLTLPLQTPNGAMDAPARLRLYARQIAKAVFAHNFWFVSSDGGTSERGFWINYAEDKMGLDIATAELLRVRSQGGSTPALLLEAKSWGDLRKYHLNRIETMRQQAAVAFAEDSILPAMSELFADVVSIMVAGEFQAPTDSGSPKGFFAPVLSTLWSQYLQHLSTEDRGAFLSVFLGTAEMQYARYWNQPIHEIAEQANRSFLQAFEKRWGSVQTTMLNQ